MGSAGANVRKADGKCCRLSTQQQLANVRRAIRRRRRLSTQRKGYLKVPPTIVSASPGRCRVKRACAQSGRWSCGLPLVAGELEERDMACREG